MLFPLGDSNPTERFAFVTAGLIAVNAIVFVYELMLGPELNSFVAAYGMVPFEITRFADLAGGGVAGPIVHAPGPPLIQLTLLTSMFIHGGFLHLIGNMLYLWIFGNNIEDLLGPIKFLVFYLVTGVLAGLAHVMVTVLFGMNPLVPCIGASGAISGILGGYIVFFPHRRVRVIWLYQVMHVPALVAIGIWFLFQLFSGVGSAGSPGGGVAYGAHIGGFIAGVVLVRFFGRPRPALQVA